MSTFFRVKFFLPQKGFAYIVLLFLVVAISISLAIVSQDDATIQMREKERDWLFIGQQYQQAIKSYYEQSPDGIKTLPMSIEDLVLDSRFIKPVHHLRKAYLDPLTGKEWALMRDEEGFLIGVYSASPFPVLLQQATQSFETAGPIAQHADVKFFAKIEAKEADESNDEQDESQLDIEVPDALQEADTN